MMQYKLFFCIFLYDLNNPHLYQNNYFKYNLFTTLNLQNYVITKYVSIHMSTLVTYYYDAEATDSFLSLEYVYVFAFG